MVDVPPHHECGARSEAASAKRSSRWVSLSVPSVMAIVITTAGLGGGLFERSGDVSLLSYQGSSKSSGGL